MAIPTNQFLENLKNNVEANPEILESELQKADAYRKVQASETEMQRAAGNQELANTFANYTNDFNAAYELLQKMKEGR